MSYESKCSGVTVPAGPSHALTCCRTPTPHGGGTAKSRRSRGICSKSGCCARYLPRDDWESMVRGMHSKFKFKYCEYGKRRQLSHSFDKGKNCRATQERRWSYDFGGCWSFCTLALLRLLLLCLLPHEEGRTRKQVGRNAGCRKRCSNGIIFSGKLRECTPGVTIALRRHFDFKAVS